METRTQIVTTLVAAFLANADKMKYIRDNMDDEFTIYLTDYEMAVMYANIVADEIINKTTPEIAFQEKVV